MADKAAFDELKKGKSDIAVEGIILQRWSPRAFSDAPVSDEQLNQIFTAAPGPRLPITNNRGASSSAAKETRPGEKSLRPCFLSTGPGPSRLMSCMSPSPRKSFTLTQLPNASYVHDVGAATAMASLQATALGLYTHGMRGFNAEMLSETFAVPGDFDPVACWALGHFGKPAALPDNFKTMEDAPRTRKILVGTRLRQWDQAAL